MRRDRNKEKKQDIKRNNSEDFNLTEPVFLAFEREIEDSKILKRSRKRERKTSFFVKLLRFIFIIIIIFGIGYLAIWYRNNAQNNKIVNELSNQYIKEEVAENGEKDTKVDFEGLKNSNEECIGWVVVPNTKANYPVVKHSNNDYYLAHSFDKKNNPAGWIFADYRNECDGNDKNLVLYGHNRRDGSMFGTINGVLKKEWYENEENRKVILYMPNETIEYEIFSIYNVPVEEYFAKISFQNDLSYKKFLDTLKERSIYDFKVSLKDCKSIITVSTCGVTSETRTVIHAKKIEKVTEEASEEDDDTEKSTSKDKKTTNSVSENKVKTNSKK